MEIRYPITSTFLEQESFRSKAHLGIDFAMVKDTELRTLQNGIVDRIVNQPSGLGKAVYVEWENGLTAIYAHMNKVAINAGDKVNVGDLIGYSGNTGNVVGKNGGYHLHFAIKDKLGKFIDPAPYTHLVQEMNHNLESLVAKMNNTSTPDLLHQAMDYFLDTLQGMDIQTLIDNTVLVQYF